VERTEERKNYALGDSSVYFPLYCSRFSLSFSLAVSCVVISLFNPTVLSFYTR